MGANGLKPQALLDEFADMGFLDFDDGKSKERVFERRIFRVEGEKRLRIPLYVRVYSTLVGGKFRENGDDAVRVIVIRRFKDGQDDKIVHMTTKVNRTGTNRAFCSRVRERAKEAWVKGLELWAQEKKGEQPAPAPNGRKDWRSDPATDKQKAKYRSLTGKDLPDGCTKGNASDLIDGASPLDQKTKRKRWVPKGDEVTFAQWRFLKTLTGYDFQQHPDAKKITRAIASKMIEAAVKARREKKSQLDAKQAAIVAWIGQKSEVTSGKKKYAF